MMNTWYDPNLPSEVRTQAEAVISELGIDHLALRVRFLSKPQLITFTQDRRVVEMPLKLAQESRWSDIRFLFRAVLGSAPSAWNVTADDNDWSAHKHHAYHKT